MKSTVLKFSLFTFLSAIVCTIGYFLLQLDLITYIRDALYLSAYVCFFAWVSQLIYKRVKNGVCTTISLMSFVLAIYTGAYAGLTTKEFLSIYVSYAFYLFTIACLVSVIVLIGQMIFTSKNEAPAKITDNSETVEDPEQESRS